MGPRAGLDAVEKIEIPSPCRESNPDLYFSVSVGVLGIGFHESSITADSALTKLARHHAEAFKPIVYPKKKRDGLASHLLPTIAAKP
jgi:hypothetical protein